MARRLKAIRRYKASINAFEIIQECQPIRLNEVSGQMAIRQGVEISPEQLGKLLRPYVANGQLIKTIKRDGRYYSVGNQSIIGNPLNNPSRQ
tara:strand:+ start:4874 stop:5149 length:276 start_codon:yes stop_codon:yes gene_type:complete